VSEDKVPAWTAEDELNLKERVRIIERRTADGYVAFRQADRAVLLRAPGAIEWRKTARIIAIQLHVPFSVYTDRGKIAGEAGDWLVTNHPDDDPGSDLWSISDERMRSTYAPVRFPLPESESRRSRGRSMDRAEAIISSSGSTRRASPAAGGSGRPSSASPPCPE
jgi:hypothetical protein